MKQEIENFDTGFLLAALLILGIGVVMVTSASMPYAESKHLPLFFFAKRHMAYVLVGIVLMCMISYVPIRFWERINGLLFVTSLVALAVLLVPGVSHAVNGSVRWLYLGPISIQVSEIVKFAYVLYMASYLLRKNEELHDDLWGFIKPMMVLGVMTLLLLLEPDFGAAVVIVGTGMGLMFLSGVPLQRFFLLLPVVVAAFLTLSVSSPYRIQRLISFSNPWANQFDSGYQLTQSLIAFGRGGLWGEGLGNSVQKLLYLPEPHNDFIFAVLAEELGLIGVLLVLGIYGLFIARTLAIGKRANEMDKHYAGFLAYGVALWISLQVLINVGVSVGLLPTKGMTLPLLSYGGSSICVVCMAMGVVLRVDYETRIQMRKQRR